jgi:hypothetical protein
MRGPARPARPHMNDWDSRLKLRRWRSESELQLTIIVREKQRESGREVDLLRKDSTHADPLTTLYLEARPLLVGDKMYLPVDQRWDMNSIVPVLVIMVVQVTPRAPIPCPAEPAGTVESTAIEE